MSEIEKQYLGKLINGPLSESIMILNNNIRCIITAINSDPDDACDGQKIEVVNSDLAQAGFVDDNTLDDDSRKQALNEYLKNRLFVFNVYQSQTNSQPFFVKHDTLNFIKSETQYNHYKNVAITNFSDRLKFNQSLLKSQPIRIDGLLGLGSDSSISAVIVHDPFKGLDDDIGYLYTNLVAKEKFPSVSNVVFYLPTEDNPIEVRVINMDRLNHGILFNQDHSIAFIPSDFELNTFTATLANLGQEFSDDDRQFIKQFKDVIRTDKYRLVINDDDLLNIHTSIKSNLLTVLTGISGTGKSRIVKAYSEALGIDKDNDRFKFISVRPFWQDDSDLLGFVDNMTKNYHPGDTGLIETLQRANADPDNIYLITLDEMNLARVEYYFSQFLSVLERDPEDRYINLYDHYLERRLNNGDRYPSSILIPKNVRFIGTMNVDDSTFEFSDKLLDRANVIHLKPQAFKHRNQFTDNPDIDKLRHSSHFKWYSYSLYAHNNGFKFNDDYLDMLWALNEVINGANPNQGVSWRTVNAIENFIRNLPEDTLNVSHEFDRQLASRILTKLRGTNDMLSTMFQTGADDQLQGPLIDVFDKYPAISDFKTSRQVLLNKEKELKINGFAR